MLITIPQTNLENLKKEISRLSKKAIRNGMKEIGMQVIGNTVLNDGIKTVAAVNVEIDSFDLTIKGYRVIGFTSKGRDTDTAVTINLGSGEVPAMFWGRHVCDHCNTNRKRHKTYFLQKENDVIQVGTSCVNDYLNIDDNKSINLANMYDVFARFNEVIEESKQIDDNEVNILTVAQVVDLAHAVISKYGYVSGKKAEYENIISTKQEMIFFEENFIETVDINRVLSYVNNLSDDSQFHFNIKSIFSNSHIESKFYGFVAYVVYTVFFTANEVLSQFVGKVNDKITVEAKEVKAIPLDSIYGTKIMNLITDSHGNVFKWITSRAVKEGQTLTGRVKSHDTFNHINQTTLTRCSIS